MAAADDTSILVVIVDVNPTFWSSRHAVDGDKKSGGENGLLTMLEQVRILQATVNNCQSLLAISPTNIRNYPTMLPHIGNMCVSGTAHAATSLCESVSVPLAATSLFQRLQPLEHWQQTGGHRHQLFCVVSRRHVESSSLSLKALLGLHLCFQGLGFRALKEEVQ